MDTLGSPKCKVTLKDSLLRKMFRSIIMVVHLPKVFKLCKACQNLACKSVALPKTVVPLGTSAPMVWNDVKSGILP